MELTSEELIDIVCEENARMNGILIALINKTVLGGS